MNKMIYIILLLYVPWGLSAQPFSIQGQVLDVETKQPIEFSTIYVENEGKGTMSNSDGFFEINVNSLPCTIQIRHLSYLNESLTIEDATNEIKVFLVLSTIELAEVSVSYLNSLMLRAYEKLLQDSSFLYSQIFYRQTTRRNEKKRPEEVKEMFCWSKSNNKGVLACVLDKGRYARQGLGYTNFSNHTKITQFNLDLLIRDSTTQHLTYSLGRSFKQGNVIEIKYGCDGCKNMGSMFINTKTATLERWLFDLFLDDGFWSVTSSSPDIKIRVQKYTYDLTFQTIENVTVMESLKVDLYYDREVKRAKDRVHVSSIAWFYNYNATPEPSIVYGITLEDDFEAIRKTPYDPVFWENHPVIRRTEGEKASIKLFEKSKLFDTNIL